MSDKKTDGTSRRVRVEDVARVAGVSPITVSRALSNPEKVKEETRQRVAEAVAQTGYVVNSFASTLRSGRSSIITVFVSSLQNPHYAASIQGLIDALEGSRFRLMFAQTGFSVDADSDLFNSLMSFRPAAVVLSEGVRSESLRNTLTDFDVPVLEMWDDDPDPIDMLVGFSVADASRMVGEHFAEQGFRHVAYFGHSSGRTAERLTGFRAGLARHGIDEVYVHSFEGTGTMMMGMSAFEEIVTEHPDCDAIFFATDLLATGALLRAREMGIDVPGRVAIAGFGDLDYAAHTQPPLTTIHVSAYELGKDAGQMLLKRLDTGPLPNRRLIRPVRLEARGSTAR
ncbi:LacI family DNA-binding transcriptional regulator [Devosia sp.]|uniref:LacI family DNA-binding transcriptional regulator n=1 Tax=Devosia sp. TaxID=1871048 RepID=UPI003A9548AC